MRIRSLDRAREYLTGVVASHRRMNQSRLPTVAALAERAGVALVTMSRAVQQCAASGAITAKRGQGILLAEPHHGAVPGHGPGRAVQRWEAVREQLQRDLLTGTFGLRGPLPSPKELAVSYGVCYRTLKRALDRLVEDRILMVRDRRYVRAGTTAGVSHGAVALVASGYANGEMRLLSHRTQQLIQALATACALSGMRLEVSPYDNDSGRLAVRSRTVLGLGSQRRAQRTLLGCVVLPLTIPGAQVRTLCAEILDTGVPVAVLDETTDLSFDVALRDRRARLFRLATNRTACRTVAMHLASLGHRRVAFVSPIMRGSWPHDRCASLQSAFREAGFGEAVVTFAAPESPLPPLSGDAVLDSDTQVLIERTRTVRSLRYQVELITQREQVLPVLVPLMEQALADSSITAWVAVNDDIAIECINFLRSRGKRVPRDISVVGFDDNLEAFFRSLTSYNYNASAAANAMLSHVLSPTVSLARREIAGATEIEGFLDVRGSSGPVPEG